MKNLLYLILILQMPFVVFAQDKAIMTLADQSGVINKSQTIEFGVQVLLAPPLNDDCANSTVITNNTTLTGQTTIGATVQPGESFGCRTSADQSVWYSFVATSTSRVVSISWTASSGCYFSSAIYDTPCPATGTCAMVSCQSAANGPFVHDHVLRNLVVGQKYYVQVMYACTGGGPSFGADFSIGVGSTPLMSRPSNPIPMSTPASPGGTLCVFASPPGLMQVISNCTKYTNPLTGPNTTNEVVRACFSLPTGTATSISFQNLITSNCGSGNVSWLKWEIYNALGQLVACGDLNSGLTVNGLTCNTTYTLCYMYEITACTHTDFTPYAWANNVACAPLPVELLKFSALAQNGKVKVNWVTANEHNNDYFLIERSRDGLIFEEVSKVRGAGTSQIQIDYEVFDEEPLGGISYYRLKQIDFDGTTVVPADMVAVSIKSQKDFQISNSEYGFDLESPSDGELVVFSLDGRLVLKSRVKKGSQIIESHLEGSGLYVYRFISSTTNLSGKIVK